MKTVLEVLKASTHYLTQKGIEKPRRLMEEVLSDILEVKRVDLYLQFDRPLEAGELDRCRQGLTRLAKREPWQYVCGSVDFLDVSIKVGPDVLIPRQETEILADIIVKQIKEKGSDGKVLWDICCGSGCLGIAIKNRFPDLRVILTDISDKALAVAADNARHNETSVEIVQGDLLASLEGQRCDYFVCNPPYISEGEYDQLEPEVRAFEPRQALVSGPLGTEFYHRLATDLRDKVNPGCMGWLELGTGQGEAVHAAFASKGWNRCRFERDWAGHDRFFFLETE